MAANEDLVVKIKADIRSLQAGLRQAAKEADIAGKAMQTGLGDRMTTVQNAITRGAGAAGAALLGIGTAAVAAGGAFAVLFNKALQTADGLVKLSDKTGIGIEELQRLQFVAGQVGLGVDQMETSLNKFTLSIGHAQREGGKAAEAFERLGVALSDGKGPRAAEAVFLDVLRALEGMPDAAARASAAQGIFGKGAVDLALLASQGAGGLDKLRAEANRLAIVLGEKAVRAGDNAGDAMGRLKLVISAGLNKAVLQAAPDIEKFINELLADPQKMQETIDKFVTVGKAIADVSMAATRGIGHVVNWAEAISRMMERREISNLAEEAKRLRGEIERKSSGKGFLKLFGRDVDDEVGKAQKRLADVDAQLKAFTSRAIAGAIPTIPAINGADVTIPLRAAGTGTAQPPTPRVEPPQKKEKGAVEDVLKADLDRRISAEETANFISSIEDGAAQERTARLQAEVDQNREAQDKRVEDFNSFQDQLLDSQARQLLEEQAGYDARRAMLDEFSEAELEAIGGYNEIKEKLAQEHEEKVAELRRQNLQSGFDFLTKIEDDKLREQADNAAVGLQQAATFSKKAFEVNKALATANAIVKGVDAVQGAYAVGAGIGGPVLGAAFAAIAAATAAANVRAIQSTKFGGGGASRSVAGAGNPNNTTQAGGGGPQISLTIQGGGSVSQEEVRRLIGDINEALADGATLGPR